MPLRHIHPRYRVLEKYISSLDVQGFYESSPALTLYKKRNTLRRFKVENVDFVIKSFEHTVWINKFVYGLGLRTTKAERGWTYANKLLELGVDTPLPIATVECRRCGKLKRSYFCYLYSKNQPLLEVMEHLGELPEEQQDQWISEVTDFLIMLHDKGIIHKDLHMNNILYKTLEDGSHQFQFIDINRMKFLKKVSPKERLSNFDNIIHDDVLMERILYSYAEKAGIDDKLVQKERKRRYRKEHVTKPIRHFFKRLFKGGKKRG